MNPRHALKPVVLAIAVTFSGLATARTYTTLALPELTSDLTTWTLGATYAGLFPGSQVLGGVPFQFQSNVSGNNVFAGSGGGNIAGPGQTVIPVGVFGVTDVYTIINTAWGSAAAEVGSITFNGSDGASYTVKLIEGDNVRDHYFGGYVNTTTASYVTQSVWGANTAGTAHLDLQDFVLPAAFASQTLTNIVFDSTGGSLGSPFIAAATVAAVPEPETYAALIAGLVILAAHRRRKHPVV